MPCNACTSSNAMPPLPTSTMRRTLGSRETSSSTVVLSLKVTTAGCSARLCKQLQKNQRLFPTRANVSVLICWTCSHCLTLGTAPVQMHKRSYLQSPPSLRRTNFSTVSMAVTWSIRTSRFEKGSEERSRSTTAVENYFKTLTSLQIGLYGDG
jgi:hypothetical protein